MGELILDEPRSVIKHEGNYFIMDSEQLVCNPFADMQNEVMTEAQKKASMTEKLTSVKNNVCENHFAMEKAQLEREKTWAMKKLHDSSSKLRYEVKLLDLDRQRHKIEVKKRVKPERDYSYDETQLCNTEKRLGANICSFYLERKMKFPTRLKSVSDIGTTPLVRKARQALKEHDTERVGTSMDFASSNLRDRAQTAKTISSLATTTASPVRPIKLLTRRNSRSAPLVLRSFSGPITKTDQKEEAPTRLPAINDASETQSSVANGEKDGVRGGGLSNGLVVGGGGGGGVRGGVIHPTALSNKPLGHVKFMFEDPLRILTTKDKDSDSASLLSRPYTYHPGMGDRDRYNSRDYFLDTSDDDDDPYLPDHIDLRALLFDREGHRGEEVARSHTTHTNQVPTPLLRRSNTYAPRITQDLIQQENDVVQSKVDRFLQELENGHRHDDYDSDLDIEEDLFTKARPAATLKTATTTTAPPVVVPPIVTTKPSQSTEDTTPQDTADRLKEKAERDENKTPRLPNKDGWRYIRGRDKDGSLRGTYSAEDLVLQTITGMPLSRSLTAGIPLHSAGRAMRHTPTFKMRKVVERLINERTKFQQHEIDEIKRKVEQGMDVNAAAASLAPANPTPGLGPPGGPPPGAFLFSRNNSRMERMPSVSMGSPGIQSASPVS